MRGSGQINIISYENSSRSIISSKIRNSGISNIFIVIIFSSETTSRSIISVNIIDSHVNIIGNINITDITINHNDNIIDNITNDNITSDTSASH